MTVAASTGSWEMEVDEQDAAKVTILEDDTAGLAVSQRTLRFAEACMQAYTPVLDSRLTHNVTITTTASADGVVHRQEGGRRGQEPDHQPSGSQQ